MPPPSSSDNANYLGPQGAVGGHPVSIWQRMTRLQAVSADLHNADLIRFIASCGIVLMHSAEFLVPRHFRAESHDYTAGLSLFVDVFFVISGFVIAFVYAGRMENLPDFLKFMQRRVGRLVPLHLLTLAMATAIFAAAMLLRLPVNNGPDLSAQCLVSAALLVHAWGSCNVMAPNGASWSISAEMAVYLLFPLILIAIRSSIAIRTFCFVGLVAACAALSGGLAEMSEGYSALRAIPPFYLGVLVHAERARLRLPEQLRAAPFLLAGVLIAGSLLRWPRELLLVVAYAIAVTAVLADTSQIKTAIVSRLAPLGQITYSAYMLHTVILTVFVNAICDKWLKLEAVPLAIVTILTWFLILVASLASFHFFETPLRKRIDAIEFGFLSRRPKR